ncbi:MAG: hypothetical protein J7L44_01470, partial [Candidatus Diapherotrites archaeon]|nr:hypothetical protein [Candidatus Diapherotrites archaeon]
LLLAIHYFVLTVFFISFVYGLHISTASSCSSRIFINADSRSKFSFALPYSIAFANSFETEAPTR